jgi:biotin carboxylase
MCHHVKNAETNASPTILHMYSAPYIQAYRETVEPKFIAMLEGLGVKNAILSLQGFVDNGKFYFHETGYRMGGGRSYVFTEKLNNVSALDLMIEYAVTGKIEGTALKDNDDPIFSKSCCNYYVPLKPGTIKEIHGLDEVRAMPQVLDIAVCHNVGDVISKTNSLDSVLYRMHVMDENPRALAETLSKISHTLRILSEEGYEMQLEELSVERAYEMTGDSCLK